MTTLSERITATVEGKKAWNQERLIFNVTERLCELLQEKGISRSDLAKRMGTSKGYITQLLDEESNMTLRTLSDAFVALDRAVQIHDSPLTLEYENPCVLQLHNPNPEWDEDTSSDPSIVWRYKSN